MIIENSYGVLVYDCAMYYVPGVIYYGICTTDHGPWTLEYYVLRTMYCVLFIKLCVLCTVYHLPHIPTLWGTWQVTSNVS